MDELTGNAPEGGSDADAIRQSWTEPNAFGILFRRHAPHLHRYLALRLGRDVAEDVVAETFVAAFGRRRSYDLSRESARPWLFGIANNLVGQHRRQEARQLRLHRALVPEMTDAGHADQVAIDATARAWAPALYRALAKLPTNHRHVVLLIAWGQLSYDEVSEALNIPVGTVRSRLSRARSRLKQSLAEDNPTATFKEGILHG